jgi:hypothetical protein
MKPGRDAQPSAQSDREHFDLCDLIRHRQDEIRGRPMTRYEEWLERIADWSPGDFLERAAMIICLSGSGALALTLAAWIFRDLFLR